MALMHTPFVIDLVGWAGAVAVLAAYALITARRVTSTTPLFVALNLSGAAALFVNGMAHDAWPSAILNVAWLLIGVGGVVAATRSRTSAPQPSASCGAGSLATVSSASTP